MTAENSERLAIYAGEFVSLTSRAHRFPATGANVVARKGAAERRVVLVAHFDAKMRMPGTVDNASGVVVMLLLAELLAGYSGSLGAKIVALNGEDYYSNAGDHPLFLLHQRPALALTSAKIEEVMAIIHTMADHPDIVDTDRLVDTATTLHALLLALAAEAG